MHRIIIIIKIYNRRLVKKMKCCRRHQYRWKGAKNDLMELVYCLYLTKRVTKASGEAIPLYEMTALIYKMFGLKPPRNPSRVVDSLRERVNRKKRSVFYQSLSNLYHEYF